MWLWLRRCCFMKPGDSVAANAEPMPLPTRLLIAGGALGGVAVIGWLDFATGVEYRVYPLYFLPLSVAAWHFGRRGALGGSVLCALTWLGSNYLAGSSSVTGQIWIFNFFVQGIAFLVVGWLIAILRGALAKEVLLSRIDPLTSLLNRRSFYDSSERILEVGRRYGRPVTLAYIDLDNFKSVNDSLGHDTGDETLRRVAGLLREAIRRGDIPARFGGDEFVVLLPETGPDGARPLLERLRSSMEEMFKETRCPITASIGAVSYTRPPVEIEELVRQADDAMYVAKAEGKNRIILRIGVPPVPAARSV